MIFALLAVSTGWVTISQSRHGAQLNTIKSQMAGEQLDYGPMVQQTLGYLWDLPASSTSTRGLGGGITWAWDPVLCDDLQPQFREDFFFIEYISCRDLKAAMHRGFNSWSDNSAKVSFLEVGGVEAQLVVAVPPWVHIRNLSHPNPWGEGKPGGGKLR